VNSDHCAPCAIERAKRWSKENNDRALRQALAWKRANRERVRAIHRKSMRVRYSRRMAAAIQSKGGRC
jgi:hypothetical protein